MRRSAVLAIMFLFLLSGSEDLLAQGQDAPGTSDHSMISRYAGSVIDATGHIAIYGIYFDTNSENLKEGSDSTLEEIGRLLKERPSLNLLVVGHTDSQGGYDYNMDLSQRRAAAVVKALVDGFELDSNRLTAAGVGYLSPVVSSDAAEGRARNRRVELVKH